MGSRIKKREFSQGFWNYMRSNLALPPWATGNIFFVAGSTTAFYTQLINMGVPTNNLFSLYTDAYAAVTDGNNDSIVIFPGQNSMGTDALVHSKTYYNIIGAASPMPFGNRARLDLTGINAATAYTISGRGVYMSRVKFEWGAANSNALVMLSLTYSGNSGNLFEDVCFEGPNDATEGAKAFKIINVANGTQDFAMRRCYVGSFSAVAAQNLGALIYFAGDQARIRVEDSEFITNSNSTSVVPITFAGNFSSEGSGLFKNCYFGNAQVATQPAVVCAGITAGNGKITFLKCGTSYAAFAAANSSIKVINGAADAAAGGVAIAAA